MEQYLEGEALLSRQVAAGVLTRQDADELRQRLSLLAFNMTLARQESQMPSAAAAYWLFHLRTRKLSRLPQANQQEQEQARTWWALGEAAGVLQTSEQNIAFTEYAWQIAWCAHFCLSCPFDARLLRLMGHDQFREVWRLWARQDPGIALRLVSFLHPPHTREVRFRAAKALGYLGNPRATDALIAALGDQSGGVRLKAAQALGGIGNPRAIEPIVQRLHHEHVSAHTPLIEALASFGAPAVPTLLRLLEAEQKTIIRPVFVALRKLREPQALQPLFFLLAKADPVTSTQAAWTLADFGEPGLLLLLQALHAPAWRARWAAIRALGHAQEPRAIEPLLAVLRRRTEHFFVRQAAHDALVALASVWDFGRLLQALMNKNPQVAACAAEALGKRGDKRAVLHLIRVLQEGQYTRSFWHAVLPNRFWFRYRHYWPRPNWMRAFRLLGIYPAVDPRKAAIRALGRLGDERGVEPLIQALQSQDAGIRSSTAEALGMLGDARAVDPLIQALQDRRSWDVRVEAARALGTLKDARAVAPLLQALTTLSTRFRGEVVSALGKLGDTRATELLLELLGQVDWSESSPMLGRWLISALGQLQDTRAVEPLLKLLQDERPGARAQHPSLVEALGRIGDPRAVEPLIGLLRGEDIWIRSYVARALGQIGDRRALRPLFHALNTHSAKDYSGKKTTEAAALAIERIKGKAQEQ